MKKLTLKNVHDYVKGLYQWNKENGFNLTYADCIAYAFQLFNEGKIDELKALKNITSDTQEVKKEEKAINTMPLINNNLLMEYDIDPLVIYELIEKRLTKGIERNVVTEGFEKIEQAKTLNELKKAVLLYFADVQIRKNAHKYITLGMNHKKLEKHLTEEEKRQYIRYDFNYISPNADMIRAEAEDVLQDVRLTIEKGFKNDNIFSSKINLYSALKLLVSNALRTEINRKFNSNVTIKNFNDFNINGKDGEEASDNEKMDIVVNKRVEETSNYNKALSMLEEIDFLTDYEKEIFKLKLQGYSEKEINDMKGKRLDRVYRKIDKKFMERLGITDHKQFRSMFKSTKRNLAK